MLNDRALGNARGYVLVVVGEAVCLIGVGDLEVLVALAGGQLVRGSLFAHVLEALGEIGEIVLGGSLGARGESGDAADNAYDDERDRTARDLRFLEHRLILRCERSST
jgi:hypothetical protein